jgi:thiosulfate/3-mercaptopyruvate sulfurtransferase
MVPGAELFAAKAGAFGIGSDMRVVCYDVYGGASAAARAWWMFRLFGHDDVAVLNGGLRVWRAEDRETESGEPAAPAPKSFSAKLDPALLRTIDQVRANIESRAEQLADARSPGRFDGSEPEIRPGIRGGHIPGSLNLFFADLIDRENHGALKSADRLAKIIARSGVDPAKPVITSCGSGVTACVPALAFYLLGYPDAAIYDGSWTEWGGRDDTPIDTGPAD